MTLRSAAPAATIFLSALVALTGCGEGAMEPDIVPGLVSPVPRPEFVRGVYVSAFAAGDPARLETLLELAAASEINTFVVDVKEFGEVSHMSTVPLAVDVGAGRAYISDLSVFLRALREAGIYPIARIVCFRDPVLAEGRPEFAIRTSAGGVWVDEETQRPWVDAFNEGVWAYNIDLAREALEAGFAEIQWDYVRLPDVVSDASGEPLVFPAAAGRTPVEAITGFIERARAELASFDAPLTADVFGRVASSPPDEIIGQDFEALVARTDVLLPMVYPSLYFPGSFGVPDPARDPYGIVRAALDTAVVRLARTPGATATIRPWLQAFSLNGVEYGTAQIQEQVRATYDAGLREWLFWSPISDYPSDAF